MLLGSKTLTPRQAINFCNYESFQSFVPIDKSQQVWFQLVDRKTHDIIKPKVAMTHTQADSKNEKISDMGFAWVRI